MPTARELLISTIEERRPLVLLLGQDAWIDSKSGDALLATALNKLGRRGQANRGWAGILAGDPLPAAYYEWLAERFERRVHPPFIQALSDLPWSAIFTPSVDPTLVELLSRRGREAEPILTAAEYPRAARSRARPPLYYLFSRAGEQDPKAQPPTDRLGLIARRSQHALLLLERIRETATPLGTIIVDGFMHGSGWLRFEDLIGALTNASLNQILWFGGRPDLLDDDAADFEKMERDGRIVVDAFRLGTAVAELTATGRLADTIPVETEDAGRVSIGAIGSLEVKPEVRLGVEAVASIVDDSWTSFLPPLGPDSGYDAFRRFHGHLGGPRLLVEGVRRGFAIERDFENQLFKRVSSALVDHSKLSSPIVVDGQSGTGKSVALARIVARVRENKVAPVLYSIGRVPQSQEVADFCQDAEKAHAPATLVVCDANRDIDSYDELLSGLRSRGRRVVVLGSQYRGSAADKACTHARIEAPVALSKAERRNLENLLRAFDLTSQTQLEGNHFLAILYRHLPASRPRIGSGLGAEARATARLLDQRGSQPHAVPVINQLHQQLIDKGYVSAYQPTLNVRKGDRLEDHEGSAGRIIDMVMVAGRLNCPVPVNLLIRAVSDQYHRVDATLVSELFRDLDLFRWRSNDSEGNEWRVLPRLPLEAQLICERRLGSSLAEARVLVDLIAAVRLGFDDAHEREFLLNLLQQIGRDGPRGNAYKSSYVEIARKLTELRNRFNVIDASIMLQESAFRRSAIREEEVQDDQRIRLLEEARESVQAALDGIDNGQIRAARRTRQNLLVERAALYGFLAYDRAQRKETSAAIWGAYVAARVAVRQAVSAADNYYPHDVGLWTPTDLFESADLTEFQRAELAADIYSILDQIEQDSLPPTQREKFQWRRMSVGDALNDHELSDAAYNELEKSGSTAGYFLRARQYAPDLAKEDIQVKDPSDVRKAKRAAEFLTERFEKIQQDERCLWLLLENKWITVMGRRPLRGERQPLPSGDDRAQLLTIVRTLNSAAGQSSRYGTRCLEAVLTWLIGDYVTAREIFQQLDRDTDNVYRGRIFLRHIVCDTDGTPINFTGRVERDRGGGRWRLRVDHLNHTIDLHERDFPREEIRYGRTISNFMIAFNFIGPIAAPIRR